MSNRLSPAELVCSVVDGISEIDACYPNFQPQATPYPAVVYGGVATRSEPTWDDPTRSTQILRVDIRGRDPGDLEDYGASIRRGISEAGRLNQDLGTLDDYDTVLEVHRHILTLSVRF